MTNDDENFLGKRWRVLAGIVGLLMVGLIAVAVMGPALENRFAPDSRSERQLITLAVASSLRSVVEALRPKIVEAFPEFEVRLVFGASSALIDQVKHGASVDVLIAAGSQDMGRLGAQLVPFVAGKSRLCDYAIAENELVFTATKKDLAKFTPTTSGELPNWLEIAHSADLKHIAASPPTVPLGYYTHQMLEHLRGKDRDPVEQKLVFADSDVATTQLLLNGHAQAGFIFLTDALMATEKLEILRRFTEKDVGVRIFYYARPVHHSKSNLTNAWRVVDFLRGAPAQNIIRGFGFKSPEGTAGSVAQAAPIGRQNQ